jgi:multidrug efflux pump subunit AcrB
MTGPLASSLRDATGKNHFGPIAWMAKNTVAANLLMIVIIIGGGIGLTRVKQEVFPAFDVDQVVATVAYPGASPSEIEQGILLVVEEAVRSLDGVKRVSSNASEGIGTVKVELLLGQNNDKILADIKTAIDAIRSFPLEAEEPSVRLVATKQQVISVVIAGDIPILSLHALAEKARRELLEKDGITQVSIDGIPPLEISIEISRNTMQKFGLTQAEIAQQIRAASLELPGGSIETKGGELLVRVSDRRLSGVEFENIVIRSTRDGSRVRLSEIATIKDGFADDNQDTAFNGKNGCRVTAYRVGDETPAGVAKIVRDYAEELEAEVPDTVSITIWNDTSITLDARIKLLVNNAFSGLILVLIILGLFLEARLAFWVALGIPVSFLGTFLLMPQFDASINMISLFGFIITIGMVVDDAIIIAENVFHKRQSGLPPIEAAIVGGREMAVPVTFAILTTATAFAPMLFVPGTSGKIFAIFPIIIFGVLTFSLVESFYILPAHLAHISSKTPNLFFRTIDIPRRYFSIGLQWATEQLVGRALVVVLKNRYQSLAVAVAAFCVTMSFVISGIIPFNFFPELEGDQVRVVAQLPYGAPIERTHEVRRIIEDAAKKTIAEKGGKSIYRGIFTRVGEGPTLRGPGASGSSEKGSHILNVEVNLVPVEERTFSAFDFASDWERNSPTIPGLTSLTFNASAGPNAGAAVAVQLKGTNPEKLAAASQLLTERMREYSELTSIENSFTSGKPQFNFSLKPKARDLKLTANDIAQQVRSAYFGAEAIREQRGRNEIKVMVRLPKSERRSEYGLDQLRIRTPNGSLVPIYEVVDVTRGLAPTSIQREEGKKIVSVQAKLAAGVASARPILESLKNSAFNDIKTSFPAIDLEVVGQQRSQGETFAALGQNFIVAMFVIFALLAIPFKSYTQPLIIMAAIPFGFIGAILGHVIMGTYLSIISMFGVIALSGVVVNDSLVLIDATNKKKAEGASAFDAAIYGSKRRVRPILLTSLTTFFGLLPMIFETSLQAQFLIPMAIGLGFGVLFATPLIVFLVPAFYLILDDITGFFKGSEANHGDVSQPSAEDEPETADNLAEADKMS